jgi:hypothetical protein
MRIEVRAIIISKLSRQEKEIDLGAIDIKQKLNKV